MTSSWRDERWKIAVSSIGEDFISDIDRGLQYLADIFEDGPNKKTPSGLAPAYKAFDLRRDYSEERLKEIQDSLKKLPVFIEQAVEQIPAWAAERKKMKHAVPIAKVRKKKTELEKFLKLVKDPKTSREIEAFFKEKSEAKGVQDKALEEFKKTFKVPTGFQPANSDMSEDSFAIKSVDQGILLEFVVHPGWQDELVIIGEGTFTHGGKTYSLGRRGVDSGFYGKVSEYPKLEDAIKECLENIKNRRAKLDEMKIELTVAGKTWKMTAETLDRHKQSLKTRGSFTLTPSGFGTGYMILAKPPRSRYGVGIVEPATAKLLGYDKLWYDTFDHD